MKEALPKILIIAPNYFGFDEVIFNSFINFSGYEVITIISNKPYIYKNFGERVTNFVLKNLFKKNLKHIKRHEQITNEIRAVENCKFAIVNRADLLSDIHLELIREISGKTAAIFWDSVEKIKQQRDMAFFFDEIFSFDEGDVQKYGFSQITNFFFDEEKPSLSPLYDAFFLGSFDGRFSDLCKILTYLKKHDFTVGARLYSYEHRIKPPDLEDDILIRRDVVPFAQSGKFNQNTKVIIDVAHENQMGLSFRPFEAIGMEKKLITTNQNIINYDFYNPGNIFVIKDIDNFAIPHRFFTEPYKPVPDAVKAKYSAKAWVGNILNTLEK